MMESRRETGYKNFERRLAIEIEHKIPKESSEIIKINGQLAIKTINQIPANTLITNNEPPPTDPKKMKNYVGNITFLGVSENDGNITVTSSGPKHLTKMSPVNFLITTGIASFDSDTRLIKINQKILDQYLPKPEQTPTNQPNPGL